MNKKKTIVIILLSLIIIGLLVSIYLVLNSKDKEKPNNKKDIVVNDLSSKTLLNDIKIDRTDELSENIKILDLKYNKGTLYILGQNDNDIDVEYKIYINYLDENGVRVDRKFAWESVSKGKKFVNEITDKSSEKYHSISLSIETTKLKSYQHTYNLELSDFNILEDESGVTVKYNNNTEHDLSIILSIIYYKDGEIYFFDKGYGAVSIKPNEEGKANFYLHRIPNQEYGKDKIYDKYEIIVSSVRYDDKDY